MKKITLMMSLLLSLGSMTTSAQILSRTGWKITTSGECDDSGTGHANAIIDGKNETFWHSYWTGSTGGQGDKTNKLPQFFQVDLGSVQEFNKIGYLPRIGLHNGYVKEYKVFVSDTPFESVGDGKTAESIVNALGDTQKMKGTFDFSDNQSNLKTATANEMLRGRYVLFVATVTGGNPANKYASCAEFYLSKNTEIEAKNVICHYKINGVEYTSQTVTNVVDKSQITIPTVPFLTNGEKTDVEDGFDIACTESLPFTAQKNFDANTAHWYAMTMRGNEDNYLLSAKGGDAVGTTTVDKANHPNVLEDACQWAFVGNLMDGFKLYSKTNNIPVTLSDQLHLTEGEGTTFKLRANNNDGFGLLEKGKESNGCINRHGENKIATWTGFDDGSTIRLQEPKSYVIDYAAPFIDLDDSAAPQGAIGTNNYLTDAANKTALKNAYNAAKASTATEAEWIALGAENVKVATANTETIEVGKYYRLYNTNDVRKWLCVDNEDNSKMNCNADAEKAVASVVTFVDAEPGRYRMKIEGKTFGKYVRDNQAIALVGEDSGEKGSYIVSHVGTQFTFFDRASNNAHSYLHCNKHSLVGWEASAPSKWYVVPANNVEIAMTEANGKRYASAYLPFDVKTVNGAQAYVGELNDAKNVLNMTSVNSIPANQGFVLVGNQEKATLSIGNAEALPVANALTGSNVKVTLNDENRADNLVFGKSEGIVGFYKPATALTTIAANKAFIAASSLTAGAGAIAMNFGGNTTGINNAVVASENAPIFDLSGRRVVKAVKGGVYIQNGKKFVK